MIYKVKLVSQTNALVLIMTLIVLGLGGVWLLLPSHGLQNEALAILLVSVMAIIVYVLWQIFVTGRTEWTIDDKEINVVWTKKFILSNCKDIYLKWSEIESISRGFDPHYYNLKIKLTSGDTMRFFHDSMTTRDDFEEMLYPLYQILNKIKTQPGNKLS